MRVLFWGTPDFATPPLRALLGEGFDVIGVVTQPDRAVGRHRNSLMAPPVKGVALAEDVPVFQPETLRDPAVIEELSALRPDISIVVAYGRLLPQRIIDLPPQGTLNIHASLLPKLRGAAPIQAAIREGLTETGVSIMRMVLKLDAGPVLLRAPTPILEDETYGELQLRLSELGALALLEALTLLVAGEVIEEPQDDSRATYAPKIERDMARIDWSADTEEVCRAIRAFDPRPGAFSSRDGVEVKMFGARPVRTVSGVPGAVLDIDESGMLVGCGRGAVRVAYVHPAGKRRLAALDWAQGRGVAVGDQFGTREPFVP